MTSTFYTLGTSSFQLFLYCISIPGAKIYIVSKLCLQKKINQKKSDEFSCQLTGYYPLKFKYFHFKTESSKNCCAWELMKVISPQISLLKVHMYTLKFFINPVLTETVKQGTIDQGKELW